MTDRSTSPAGVPSGRAVRRWTRARGRARASAGLAELLSDVYVALVTVAVSAAMVLSLAAQFGADLTQAPATERAGVAFHPGWLGILVGCAVLAGLTGLIARLGPVAVSAPEAAWWLPLPIDRRSLLRPAAARWVGVALFVGALSGVMTALALGGTGDAVLVVATGSLGAALATALALAVGLAQRRPLVHGVVRASADVALAAVPVLAVALAVAGAPAPTVRTPVVLVAAALAVVGAGRLATTLDAALGQVRDASLRDRGAAATEALVATLSLDTRALGRALSQRAEVAGRTSSSALPWLARVSSRRVGAAALVTSDALVLARSPRHLVQLVVGACIPVLAVAVPEPSAWAMVVALLAGAYVAALATADGARRAQELPALDALLPLGQSQVRRYRLVVPTVAMAGWAVIVFGAVASRFGDEPGWLALGVLAAPVWAAAAVRAAYRPLPDFSGPLVVTPMGAVPPGLSSVVARGPDVAVVGSVPVLAALALGGVPVALVVVQGLLGVAALALVSRPGPR